ncbi:metalloregulator ArsR/SmtB family transcription factor [Hansschlegelia sp.]|uniref:ArsR/SmtB family transcription factor n=1 Tax=Hansschlegelia sp. TaxID=2041892 RepID=UPI002D1598A8|nr:metalloregulator ArsR/SmtB family transcription factor [Hansschlegelia sp.]HVI28549.1 metalloregulator ArsR/SmtB family transcription factor [Hansschlegelia sp.]
MPLSPTSQEAREAVALDALSALGQSTRLRIFRRLVAMGPEPVAAGVLAQALGCRQNTLSTHLAILSRAGLIVGVREGRSILYRADFDGMRGLVNYLLEDCCNGRPEVCAPVFDALADRCRCERDGAPAKETCDVA